MWWRWWCSAPRMRPDRLGVDVMLAERTDEHRTGEGLGGRAVVVGEEVEEARGEVGGDVARHEGDRHQPTRIRPILPPSTRRMYGDPLMSSLAASAAVCGAASIARGLRLCAGGSLLAHAKVKNGVTPCYRCASVRHPGSVAEDSGGARASREGSADLGVEGLDEPIDLRARVGVGGRCGAVTPWVLARRRAC